MREATKNQKRADSNPVLILPNIQRIKLILWICRKQSNASASSPVDAGSLRLLRPSPQGSVSALQGRGHGGILTNRKAELDLQARGVFFLSLGLKK